MKIPPELAAEVLHFLDLGSRECLRLVSWLFNSVFLAVFKCSPSIPGTHLRIHLAETVTFDMRFHPEESILTPDRLPHYLQEYSTCAQEDTTQLQFRLLRSDEDFDRCLHPFGPGVHPDSVHRALGRLIGSGQTGFATVAIVSAGADGYGVGRRHSVVSLLLLCHHLWAHDARVVELECLYTDVFSSERSMVDFRRLLATFPPGSSCAISHETEAIPFSNHFENLLHFLRMDGARMYGYEFKMTFHVDYHDRAMLEAGIRDCREKITQVGRASHALYAHTTHFQHFLSLRTLVKWDLCLRWKDERASVWEEERKRQQLVNPTTNQTLTIKEKVARSSYFFCRV